MMKLNRQTILIIIVAVVAVLAMAAVFFLQQEDPVSESEGTAPQALSPADYQTQFASNAEHFLLDVRTPEEFASGHIPGAVNISLQTIESRMSEIPRDMPVVVYCRSGNRSATASQLLSEAGYSEIYDMGGIQAWQAQGYPVENS